MQVQNTRDQEKKSLGMDIEDRGFVGAKTLIIHFY